MVSFKGKFFSFVLRNRHLLKGKLKQEIITKESSILDLRESMQQSAKRMSRIADDVVITPASFKYFYAEWLETKECLDDWVILYFHGGGFVSGNAEAHRNLVSKFVKKVGIKTLVFDYRLAPEHPFPAAMEDSVAIYQWLLEEGYRSERIFFAGDSAGAGLEFSCLLKLKALGVKLPKAVVAISPCVDMTISGESHKTRLKQDPCTPRGSTETWLGYYVGDGDPTNPFMSPVFADLTGLPPVMIQVGDHETLLSDSQNLAKKAEESGVKVTLHVWEGLFHCFPLLSPLFKEASLAMDEIDSFFKKHMITD